MLLLDLPRDTLAGLDLGMALPFAYLYRSLARDFTVYVFSRRRELMPGMTTRDMANDLNAVDGNLADNAAANATGNNVSNGM